MSISKNQVFDPFSIEVTKRVIEFGKRTGIKTGSYHFRYNDYKDIDIVILDTKLEKFLKHIGEDFKFTPIQIDKDEIAFFDLKLRLNEKDKYYDFIIVNKFEFEVWKEATEIFKKIIYDNNYLKVYFSEKAKRVDFFSYLRDKIRK